MEELVLCEKDRNYEVENHGIKMFSKKVRSCISEKEIRDKLINNGFKGVYMFSNDKFRETREDEHVNAYYIPDEQKIVVNSDYYASHEDVVVHELAHAYLNCKNSPEIKVNENNVAYGYGLEEGCCSIIQKANSIKNINDCVCNSYHYQVNLVKQLNALYICSSDKKYPNLIHHLLKEPDDFLPAIERIYEQILSNLDIEINAREIALKSALSMVTSTDSMVDINGYDFKYMYAINSCMNTVYLFLLDKNIRDGKKHNDLFTNFIQAQKTREERFMSFAASNEKGYFWRQVGVLSNLLIKQQDELEEYSEYAQSNYGYVKTKRRK